MFNNPGGIIAAAVILEIASVSIVALRLFSSHRREVRFTISDWLILASLVGATGLTAMEIYGIDFHLGDQGY